MPAHGKDFWGKKADEREQLEKETGKRTKKTLRFSWRKPKRKSKTSDESPLGMSN